VKRSMSVLVGVGLTSIIVAVAGISSQASVPGENGQIAFQRYDPSSHGFAIYRVNPDGSDLQRVFQQDADGPYWSPDGSEVAFFCCGDGMIAHIFNVRDNIFREIAPLADPPDLHCGLWSSDGRKIACLSSDGTDPRTGIWTIDSTDGSDPTQITSNLGGEDDPGDFSPDGMRLAFLHIAHIDESGHVSGLTIDVVRSDGTGQHQITPSKLSVQGEGRQGSGASISWSPRPGGQIIFAAQTDLDHQFSIWGVNPNGTGLHRLEIPRCGGAFADSRSVGCFDPVWSPDGAKIAFTRASPSGQNIYTVDADGSHLLQVTKGGFFSDGQPDWGTFTDPTG
jgi:Tol biopolymer transport system component